MLMPEMPTPRKSFEDDDLVRLLQPAKFYKYPRDVIADATLDVSEKRAILSAWVSNACAVESIPTLRIAPWYRAPVSFDEVMEALQRLDRMEEASDVSHISRPRRNGNDASTGG